MIGIAEAIQLVIAVVLFISLVVSIVNLRK
ncbi:Uncharacterized [Moorella glycerini]|uniref:Uncharacterized protein n=1 Tax=Neomoorella stamsii TaxID=1266720 RepID=A0A9X7J3P0_9FIRM|nr:hypothetical protein MOST_10130 [Moorella stamsii]CEP69135.1 Uncharacterized [Moorella glycerini]